MNMYKAVSAMIAILALGITSVMGMQHAVKVQNKEGLGKFFTDTEGKALYWFKKDAHGKSTCSGPCLKKWPIYYRENLTAPKNTNVTTNDFGTMTRKDGAKQTTFRGYPLYYWVHDKKPGDTNGHSINGVWFVINPDNFPPK